MKHVLPPIGTLIWPKLSFRRTTNCKQAGIKRQKALIWVIAFVAKEKLPETPSSTMIYIHSWTNVFSSLSLLDTLINTSPHSPTPTHTHTFPFSHLLLQKSLKQIDHLSGLCCFPHFVHPFLRLKFKSFFIYFLSPLCFTLWGWSHFMNKYECNAFLMVYLERIKCGESTIKIC